jgi:hypothetical protein
MGAVNERIWMRKDTCIQERPLNVLIWSCIFRVRFKIHVDQYTFQHRVCNVIVASTSATEEDH